MGEPKPKPKQYSRREFLKVTAASLAGAALNACVPKAPVISSPTATDTALPTDTLRPTVKPTNVPLNVAPQPPEKPTVQPTAVPEITANFAGLSYEKRGETAVLVDTNKKVVATLDKSTGGLIWEKSTNSLLTNMDSVQKLLSANEAKGIHFISIRLDESQPPAAYTLGPDKKVMVVQGFRGTTSYAWDNQAADLTGKENSGRLEARTKKFNTDKTLYYLQVDGSWAPWYITKKGTQELATFADGYGMWLAFRDIDYYQNNPEVDDVLNSMKAHDDFKETYAYSDIPNLSFVADISDVNYSKWIDGITSDPALKDALRNISETDIRAMLIGTVKGIRMSDKNVQQLHYIQIMPDPTNYYSLSSTIAHEAVHSTQYSADSKYLEAPAYFSGWLVAKRMGARGADALKADLKAFDMFYIR